MSLFVEAIAAVRGGADALRCHRHGDRCCKDKNQTILGDSVEKQGGRRALHDGYAPVCSLSCAGATLTHAWAFPLSTDDATLGDSTSETTISISMTLL